MKTSSPSIFDDVTEQRRLNEARENGVPWGTTTNGPAGLGRMTYTELDGLLIPCSPSEGEGPTCPVCGVG